MRAPRFRMAIPILLTAVCLEAQWQDRLYPFTELTDEMRAQIDLKDGSVEDWLEVLGEPALTPLDFLPPPSLPGYDPSSYDFRIWLAWHDATDHLFVAAEFVDDYHVSVYDHNDPNSLPIGDSSVWFFVDGDRSGGRLIQPGEPDLNHMIQAQWYAAIARTHSNDSNVQLYLRDNPPWVHSPPYADGGGTVVDSQPILSVLEFFVTPFDRYLWDPEQCAVSDLFADKTIGFAISLSDYDEFPEDLGPPEVSLDLFGPDASALSLEDYFSKLFFESDLWARGILLGADGRTDDAAVESVTWGRIKASLSE